MEIAKVGDPDLDGLISEANNYEDKINHIEIPHGRSNPMAEDWSGDEQSILRSELCKFIRISRTARPGAIYDASTAARTFTECKWGCGNEIGTTPNSQESDNVQNKIISTFEHMHGYQAFLSKKQSGVKKANLLRGSKKIGKSKRILRFAILYF